METVKVESMEKEITIMGKLKSIYQGMRHRTKKRKFPKIIPQEEFIEFAINDSNFIELFNNWRLNNYYHDIVPSIDRIDSTRGYERNNIQFLTLIDNCIKGNRDKMGTEEEKKRIEKRIEKKKGKKDLSIVLDDELYEAMRLLCFNEHISMNKFINEAVKNSLMIKGVIFRNQLNGGKG